MRAWSLALMICGIGGSLPAGAGADEAVTIDADSTGAQRFYLGGQEFHPFGVNYIHDHVGKPYQSFDMFDDAAYDRARIAADFKKIAATGFNYVRIWLKGLDVDAGWGRGASGVSPTYVERIAHTIEDARKAGMRVSLNGLFRKDQWLPGNYRPEGPGAAGLDGENRLLLDPAFAEALGRFYEDLLFDLQRRDKTILDGVFYFDLYSEIRFNLGRAPFAPPERVFAFADARYDLSLPRERQALMDRATELWFRTVAGPVRRVAPHLLLTVGGFPNIAVGHRGFDGGTRERPPGKANYFTPRPKALLAAGADFLDIHVYPSPGGHDKLVSMLAANEITPAMARAVPLIAGELGAMKVKFPTGARDGALEVRAMREAMCRFGFAGVALWTWNEEGDTWTLADDPDYRLMIPEEGGACQP